MKFHFYFLCIIALLCSNGFAAETSGTVEDDIFQSGNRFVEMGEWDRALESYRTLLDQDVVSADLYQNLAYVYRQMGDPHRSAAWLYRAAELTPRNQRLQTVIENEAEVLDRSGGRVSALMRRTAFYLRTYEWAVVVGILALVAASLYRFRRNRDGILRQPFVIMAALSFIVCVATCMFLAYRIDLLRNPRAIVLKATQLRSGPGERFGVHGELSGGSIIVDGNYRDSGFALIKLPDGNSGYVPEETIEVLAL